MFVYNVKINGSKVFKYFFITIVILIIIVLGIVCFKVFNGASSTSQNSSCIPGNQISKISDSNYTNVLKAVHENIDNYIGIKINFTGYVYRVLDLNENQFILARDMIVSSNYQSVIVGFLCEYENAKDFNDGTWVDVTGEITKGEYHGDMPIVKINDIKKVNKPNEESVYPPDQSYIPTNGLIEQIGKP